MNDIQKYRVHVGYINSNGEIIRPGVYRIDEIDVSEANKRSYITPELTIPTIPIKEEAIIIDNPIKETKVKNISSINDGCDDIPLIDLKEYDTPSLTTAFSINVETQAKITDLKYVGKKTAEKVLLERKVKPFISYDDLDKRVPLTASRKWKDVAYINFDYPHTMSLDTSPKFEKIETGSNVSK